MMHVKLKTEESFELKAFIKGRVSLAIPGSQTYKNCVRCMGHFRRVKKIKEGKTDLKDGPVLVSQNCILQDYSVCQETPTFCIQ